MSPPAYSLSGQTPVRTASRPISTCSFLKVRERRSAVQAFPQPGRNVPIRVAAPQAQITIIIGAWFRSERGVRPLRKVCRPGGQLIHLIAIVFGLDSSSLGISIVSTPSLKDAFTRSLAALLARVNERLNVP